MKEKKKGIITIGDLPPTLFSSWVHSKKSKRSGVTVVYRNADLPGEKKRQRIKFVGEKKIRLFLNVQVDRLDGCCSTTTGRRGRQQKKIEIQKTFGVSLTCVGSRWQWNKRGAIGESTLVGRFFLLHFKGLHTTGGDGKEQKLHNPITFFFIVFFYTVASSFTFSMYFFFARTSGTKEDGWYRLEKLVGCSFSNVFFSSSSSSFTLLSLNRFSKKW